MQQDITATLVSSQGGVSGMTASRLLCLAASAALSLAAADKVVGGPFVVNDIGRGATVAWIVESGQVKVQAVGVADAVAKSSPALRVEYSGLSALLPNTRYDYETPAGK